MLLDDVAAYISAATSCGFTTATSAGGNLYKVPPPETAPGLCGAVIEYTGQPGARAFSASSPNSPLWENVRFQFACRAASTQFETNRLACEYVYKLLDGVSNTIINATSGTNYLWIRALAPPNFLRFDDNHRPRHYVNFEARKAIG
jgi:hypothetical protein